VHEAYTENVVESKQTMEQKYADAIPYLRALHEELVGAQQLRAKKSA
jgi:hypothetical protein